VYQPVPSTVDFPALEREIIDDRAYWADPSTDRRGHATAIAHLLPNYDEFFIGFRDRRAIAQRLNSPDLVTGASALIGHVIVVDGQLVGGWKRTVTRNGLLVSLSLLTKLTRNEERAVRSSADAYGRFLRRPVNLTLATDA
jgi:hypothetical protein